jgi:hypothetical protein
MSDWALGRAMQRAAERGRRRNCRLRLWFQRDGWWICPHCEKQKERVQGQPAAEVLYCRHCDLLVGPGFEDPSKHRHAPELG